jgi:hypothetical protein
MKKPVTEFSNSKPWKVYIVSVLLQSYAWGLNKITGRETTHGFYYSESQNKLNRGLESVTQASLTSQRVERTFRGREYTEMRPVEHGWCNWKDSKLIGLGSIANPRIEIKNDNRGIKCFEPLFLTKY